MESRLTYRSIQTTTAWQYKIREDKKKDWLESGKYRFWENLDLSLKNARVKEVDRKTAEKIILEYEWLGDMAVTNKFYGIFFGNYCGGVICLSVKQGGGCGTALPIQLKTNPKKMVYFARGACPFWTPKGTASKLLSYTLKLLEKSNEYDLAIAYSDTDAGEYGTVYQASNWICLGKGKGRKNGELVSPEGKIHNNRILGTFAKKNNISWSDARAYFLNNGYKEQTSNAKYRYCYILNRNEKDIIHNKIKHLITEYPKREL